MPRLGRLTTATLSTCLATLALAGSGARARARRADASSTLLIWTDVRGGGPLHVSVDGRERGALTSFFLAGAPDCRETAGALAVELSADAHTIEATDDLGRRWSGRVSLPTARCIPLRLAASGAARDRSSIPADSGRTTD